MSDLRNVTIVFDGDLFFVDDYDNWPLNDKQDTYLDGIHVQDSIDIVFTTSRTESSAPFRSVVGSSAGVSSSSSGSGGVNFVLDGNGRTWWDKMIAGTFPTGGDMRPKLFVVDKCADVLLERLTLVNSPSWNLAVDGVRVEIRDFNVITDRDYKTLLKDKRRESQGRERRTRDEAPHDDDVARLDKYLSSSSDDGGYLPLPSSVKEWLVDEISKVVPKVFLEPEDLNTDGLDPSGSDFYVHRVSISNDDDSIAVKPSYFGSVGVDGTKYDCSQNMLFEDMTLTGFGASIGSVPPGVPRKCVDAITMRNVSMPGTGKGIYIKSNGNDCNGGQTSLLSNLVFEDFVIEEPFWYAIWIGPQQQHEPNQELGLDCGLAYPLAGVQCPTQGCATFSNITFRNISILNPLLSPGALLGNVTNPMRGVVFDNVVVKHDKGRPSGSGRFPWHDDTFPYEGTYKTMFVQGTCVECDPVPEGFVSITRKEYEATTTTTTTTTSKTSHVTPATLPTPLTSLVSADGYSE